MIEIVITKTKLGFSVYDKQTMNRIDLFPNTDEGFQRLITFLTNELKAQKEKK